MKLRASKKPAIALLAALSTLGLFLIGSPVGASQGVQLPGENLNAPILDNPTATNNGEGHDLDDIEELQEHWRKPEYLVDQHRQIAGIAIFGIFVAGIGLYSKKRIRARYESANSGSQL